MAGFPVLLLLLLSAWAIGSGILRFHRGQFDGWEYAGFTLACGLAVLGFGLYFTGWAGHLTWTTVWAWAGLPGVLAWPGLFRLFTGKKFFRLSLGRGEQLAAAGLFFYAALLGAAAGAPPVAYDALSYHLALPKLYLQQGAISFVPYNNTSQWPALMQMLYLPGLSAGQPQAAQTVQWFMAVLCALWVYRVGTTAWNARVGLAAAAVLSLQPLFQILSVTALIDLALCFYALMTLYAAWRYQETGRRFWLILAGLMGGCAGSVKLTGMAWLAAVLTGVWLFGNRKRPARIGDLALAGAAGVLLMLPWLIRSQMETGNPIWPLAHRMFGGLYWDAAQTEKWLRWGAEYAGGSSWTDAAARKFSGFLAIRREGDPFSSFLVPVTLGLGAVYGRRALGRRGHLALWSAAVYFTLYLFAMPQSIRYLTPLYPLLSLTAAASLAGLARARGGRRWAALPLAGLLIWFGVRGMDGRVVEKMKVACGLVSPEEHLRRSLDIYPVSAWINERLDRNARVLLLNETRGFYLDRSYIWGDPVSQKFVSYDGVADPLDMARRWRIHGITHVLVAGNRIDWRADGGTMLTELLSKSAVVTRQGPFSLYALPPIP
ncbi:MAG: ArnT family glycosyltransferase [Elusimicrobiota bacterium]